MTAAAAGRHRSGHPAPWYRRLLERLRAGRQRRQVEAAKDDAYVVRIEAHAPPPLAGARAALAAYIAAYSNAIADAHGVPPAAVLPDEDVERPWELETGQFPAIIAAMEAVMKRPELEALIWQNVPALTCGRPESRVRAMDQILAAADSYAAAFAGAALGDIDAYRRSRKPGRPPAMHFQRPGAPDRTPVCFGRASMSPVTSEPEDVTCRVCRRSGAWRDAGVIAS